MRAALAIAALMGTALAAPYKPRAEEVKVVVETVVQTVYVTEGEPTPTPAPEPVYDAPAVTTVVYEEQPAPTSQAPEPVYTPAPAPAPEEPKPTPTPSPAPQPVPVSNGYMAIVSEYRSKMGLPALTQDSKLEANALDCAVSGNGQMVHKLNPGTFAQVLAPGPDNCLNDPKAFTHVYVGGWLCEVPNAAGLDGVCASQSDGWNYQGQTGHAEILTNTAYSKIGCAEAGGIVACDLA